MDIKKITHLKGHASGIFALEQGQAPHHIFSGSSDRMLAEWSLEELAPLKFSVKTGSFIYSICHIPGKKLLLLGLYSGAIHIIDLIEKKETRFFAFHNQPVFDIKYCPANNSFYALSGDGSFSVWDAGDFSLKKQVLICREKLRNIDFNKDGSLAALACGDGTIRIFETASQEQVKKINAHKLSSNCVKFHPDGKTLVSGGRDAYLRFWDMEKNYSRSGEIPAHNYAIYAIAFSPDNKFFATASRDKTAKIWNAENFEIIARLDRKNFDGHTHSVNKLLWSPYKNYLVTASDDRTLIVWEIS